MIKRFPKVSFVKQIIILVIIMLLTLLLSFVISNIFAKRIIEQKSMNLDKKMLLQVEDSIQSYYSDMDSISASLLYSPTIQTFVDEKVILDRTLKYVDIMSVFSNTITLNNDITGIQLFNKAGVMVATEGQNIDEMAQIRPIRSTKYSDILNLTNNKSERRYTITVPVYNLISISNDYIGACVFVMGTNKFDKLLQNSLTTKNSMMMMMDQKDNVIASVGNVSQNTINVKKWKDDKQYIVQEVTLPGTGWKLVNIVPKEELLQEMGIVNKLNVVAYSVLIGILFLFLFILFVQIIKPINEIVQFMKSYPKKRTSSRFNVVLNNEIGVLAINLNKMLDEIDGLSNEIQLSQKRMYEMQIAKKQLEITSYRNQINPHFLYNTLECIRAMAFYHNIQDIADITEALSRMYRYSVKGSDFVTIKDELLHIKEYAKIIEFRFMGKIKAEINADEDILSENMIKMLLQPIVENAVFHGLEKKVENGTVFVNVKRISQNQIQFTIKDDGCGIADKQLKILQLLLQQHEEEFDSENDKGYGIGILNIYRRLKLVYGDRADMSVQSTLNIGTIVVINIHITEKCNITEEKNV